MPRVQVDAVAPNFVLDDFLGKPFELAALKGEKKIVLVFNRGFL